MFEIKDGLMVKINELDKTASIVESPKASGNIFIPTFYEKENIKYKIISIGHHAFEKCNIDVLIFPDDSEIEIFDDHCFYLSNITKLQIPAKVNKIDDSFINIKNIQEIDISPQNRHFVLHNNQYLLGTSDSNKFDILHFSMFNIEEAIIPAQIKIIKKYSFYSHKQLKSLKFEANSELKIIENNAFSYTKITDLFFPATVEEIQYKSFENTANLKTVKFPSNSNLNKMIMAFFNSKIESISLPKSVEFIDNECFYSTPNLREIEVSPENKFFRSINGDYVVTESVKNSGVFDAIFIARRNLESIKIPAHIKVINVNAFHMCRKLKNVEFEPNSSLELIQNYAFCACSIEKIVFPPSLKEIGIYSFSGNSNLKSIEFLSNSIVLKEKCLNNCNVAYIIFPNADQITFEGGAMKGIQDNAKILIKKDAKISGDCLDDFRSKICSFDDEIIRKEEEERKRKEEEERKRKEEDERKRKEEDERKRKEEEEKKPHCAACKKAIETDQCMYYSGLQYHLECVKCSVCNKTFSAGEKKDDYVCITPGMFLCREHYIEQQAPNAPSHEYMKEYDQKKKENIFEELVNQSMLQNEDTSQYSPEEVLVTQEMVDTSIEKKQFEDVLPTIALHVDKPPQKIDCDKLPEILGNDVAILDVEKNIRKKKTQVEKDSDEEEISTIITLALLSSIDLEPEEIVQKHQNYIADLKKNLNSSIENKAIIGNFVEEPKFDNPDEKRVNKALKKPSINQLQSSVVFNKDEIKEIRKKMIEKIKKDDSQKDWKFVFSHADLFKDLETQIRKDISDNPYEMIIIGQTLITSKHFAEYGEIKRELAEKALECFLYHGSKLVNHSKIAQDHFYNPAEDDKKVNRRDKGYFGVGIYGTDNIFYASKYANECHILEINEKTYVICCRSIYNKDKVNHLVDLSMLGQEIDKETTENFGINQALVGSSKDYQPISEDDKDNNEIWANEFVFPHKNQFIPCYSFTIMRKDHYILWKDENLDNNENSGYMSELSKNSEVNIYGKRSVAEAVDVIRKKKYAAVKLITNAGGEQKTGRDLILQAREIIGSNFICLVFAGNAQNHMPWISEMENVILTTKKNEFEEFASLKMNVVSVLSFIEKIRGNYEKNGYKFKINEDELLRFPNCEDIPFYKSYYYKNPLQSVCNIA